MRVPARGENCAHIQAFDAANYLLFNMPFMVPGGAAREGDWKCPICRSPAPISSLQIDSFLSMILAELEKADFTNGSKRRAGLDFESILVFNNAQWKVNGNWQPSRPITDGFYSTSAVSAPAGAGSGDESGGSHLSSDGAIWFLPSIACLVLQIHMRSQL